MKKIYLLRHGHADFSQGRYDQLTVKGQQQARLVGQYWQQLDLQFDQVYTGNLNRQIQTFNLLNKSLQINSSKVISEPRLNEFDFESLMAEFCRLNSKELNVIEYQLEPKNKKKYFRCLKQAFTAWSEELLPKHEESYLKFRQRVSSVVSDLRNAKSNNILVVSSGGILSHMIADALRLDNKMAFELNLQINNTSISSLLLGKNTTKLTTFNSLPHIEGNKSTDLVSY
jgi:broad specificity phosphatase PhoE